MDYINNDPKHIAIRKAQNTLIVVGSGIVLFGVWTAVKMLGSFFLLKEETVAAMRMLAGEGMDVLSDTAVFYITLAMVMFVMLVILAIRTYVGLSAISEGRGKKSRILYIPIAVIMIIFGLISFYINFTTVEDAGTYGALSQDTTTSGLIIELTSVIMLTEMVVSAVRIKRLRKPDGQSGGR